MQGITRFGLDATRITLVFITLVLVAGLAQFLSFPRLEDPAITIREVVVSAHFPGMKPEDIEQLITREIEAELRGMHEIEDIWSESKTGTATIHADTSDEVFISYLAATHGVEIENTGTEPLVGLRYFGPDTHDNLPTAGS